MAKLPSGVKIVPVKIVRYEVRRVDGTKVKSFSKPAQARAWVAGFVDAHKGTYAAPPKAAKRKRSRAAQE